MGDKMCELDKTNNDTPSLKDTTHPHRQLLANIDGNIDSSSDRDVTTDDELDLLNSSHDAGHVSSIIGISISPMQTHLKSPYTPAIEKAQVLEASRNYFEQEPSSAEVDDVSPLRSPDQEIESESSDVASTTVPIWRSQLTTGQRSSRSRVVSGDGQYENRSRSSSGPAALMDSLRKIFNEFPSYQGFGSSTKQDNNEGSHSTESEQAQPYNGTSIIRPQSVIRPRPQQQAYRNGLDGTASSSEHQDSRPKSLRRVTSDNSLYLRRATTGASDFDDTTAFSKVAEMPNNRFKAITDSLADSSIKMPKMPSINFSSPRSLTSRTNSEMTKQNTVFNTGNSRETTLKGRKALFAEGKPQYVPADEKKHPILIEALSRAKGDIVIMGGYRGSVLRSADPPHHQLWVPVKVGLGLRKVDLEVGLTREDEERMEEKIIPSGILAHIGPIDIARRMLKKVRKCQNVKTNQLKVHDWGYDWRLSPYFLSQKLIKFLEGLECNHPGTPPEKRGALIVAHSLGGLITRHAINLRPELFSGVVYAGAPQNCCNILGPLRNGDDVLLSSRVLTAQVNFTLRTSYLLLPENGRCFLNKDTGERYDVDFFNIDSWDEYRLSPCINPALPPFVQMPRKSMMNSITESISSFTPSLSTKRSSWFSSSNTPETSSSSPTHNAIKDTAEDAKDGVESTAKAAAEGIQSPIQEAQDSLEPSMKPSSHKSAIATAVTLPKEKAREYLTRTLAEVKQFKAELNHIQAHEDANRYPPHAIIFGKSVPTVYGAKVANREAIKCADAYDDLAFAAGDGVVLASAAQLPLGYRCVKGGRVQSDRGHIGLLGDLEGIGHCIGAVIEGRHKGIGMGSFV